MDLDLLLLQVTKSTLDISSKKTRDLDLLQSEVGHLRQPCDCPKKLYDGDILL